MTKTNGNEERPLPDGWVWTTVGKIGEIVTGTTPKKSDPENYGAFIPFVKPGDLDVGEPIQDANEYLSEKGAQLARVIPAGSVMVTCIGATIGKSGISKKTVATNQQINSIVIQEPNLPEFVYFYCLSYSAQEWIKSSASSTTLPILNKTKFSRLPIPVAPLSAQERIVAEIEKQFTRLDTAVATLNRLQANLDRYKASVLKAACEGRLVPQNPDDEPADQLLQRILVERRRQWEAQEWQNQIERAQKKVAQARRKAAGRPYYIRDLEPEDWQGIPAADYADYLPKNDKWKRKYQEPEGVETAVLPDLPEGWVWASVEQLADVLGGLTKNSKRSKLPKKMPYLRVANVYANQLDLDDVETIGITERELDRVLLEKDDLLIVEGNGSIDQIGRVALWDRRIDPCVHQNHIIKARFVNSKLADFMLFWLLSPGGRKAITKVASSTSGLYTLSLSKVNALPAPLPPLAEQKRIVDEVERRLSVVEVTQKAIAANLARAHRLRQSILQQAFTGQLV